MTLLMYEAYELNIHFPCYDNDGTPPADGAPTDPPGSTPPAGDNPGSAEGNDGKPQFSKEQQEYINSLVAAEKRRVKDQVSSQISKAKEDVDLALKAKQTTEEQAQKYQSQLDEITSQLMSKEELAKREKLRLEQEHTQKMQEALKAKSELETKYQQTLVNHAIAAAVTEHKGLSAIQFELMFGRNAKLVDDKPIISFEDRNTEGERIVSELHPSEALKRMRELPELYGNLFERDGSGGVGGNGTEPGKLGDGKVDPSSLSFAEYQKLRKENPEALGLRKSELGSY